MENVSKMICGNRVLQNVTLNMEQGKIYGIKGKNGSGKSMLLRMIAGLLVPDIGTVKVNGISLEKNRAFPVSIGILINEPGFIGRYSAFKNLKILADINGRISTNQIRDILNRLQLNPYDKKPYKRYSLGMKQKVGIAAAVMESPEVILLDEPFNALDEESIEIVHEIIKEMKERGSTIVLTCHDSEELMRCVDEMIYISAGRIVG